jgi:hypothetical protein
MATFNGLKQILLFFEKSGRPSSKFKFDDGELWSRGFCRDHVG